MKKKNMIRIVMAVVAVSLLLVAGAVRAQEPTEEETEPTETSQNEAQQTETTTPIKHFIVIMQENHTFDNYFGTYPGADGVPEGTCMPMYLTDEGEEDPEKPECVEPFHIGDSPITDLDHCIEVNGTHPRMTSQVPS